MLNALYLLSSWFGNTVNVEQMHGHVTPIHRWMT